MKRFWLLTLLALSGLAACQRVAEGGRAQEMAKRLFAELHATPRPFGVSVVSEEQFHKWGLASATARYTTDLSWPIVRDHYVQQLTVRGWRLAVRSGETEQSLLVFCRDGIKAEVEYEPDDQRPWTYALSYEWTVNVSPCH